MPAVFALGDVHPANFGGMPSADNVPIFGVNDFDEAHYAPFTWDLKRGAVGFLLAAGLAAVAIQVIIPQVPPLAEAFRATTLDVGDWLLVAGIAFAPALVAEVARMRNRAAIWVA